MSVGRGRIDIDPQVNWRVSVFLADDSPTAVTIVELEPGEFYERITVSIQFFPGSTLPGTPPQELELLRPDGSTDYFFGGATIIPAGELSPGQTLTAPYGLSQVVARYEDSDCPEDVTVEGTLDRPPVRLRAVGYDVMDDGDEDGFADAGETLDLHPIVVNGLEVDLTGVTVLIESNDPRILVINASAAYDDLPRGAEVQSAPPGTSPLRVLVTDVIGDGSPWAFSVAVMAQEYAGTSYPVTLRLAVNRDVGADPGIGADYLENFDSGETGDGQDDFVLGPLFVDNSEAIVDGSRCQVSDVEARPLRPDRCRPWAFSDWHRENASPEVPGPAFRGDGALHLGRHRVPLSGGNYELLDYTFGELSAAVSPPVTLALSGLSELAFAQIALFAPNPFRGTLGGGIVQISTDDGLSWTNLDTETMNPTNVRAAILDASEGCQFDPVDDGSTEDDRFDPEDPTNPLLGPSSTCAPEFLFADYGDAEEDGIDVGRTSAWPALPGTVGGSWLDTRLNLQGYRGETVRFRFLAATANFEFQTNPDAVRGSGWSDLLFIFPIPLEDKRGWFIDEFKVSGTAAGPVEIGPELDPPPLPVFTGVEPADGTTGVPVDTQVVVSLNLPMDHGNLDVSGIRIVGPEGEIPFALQVTPLGLDLILRASPDPLLRGRFYTLEIDASALESLGGAPFPAFVSSFRTEDPVLPPLVVNDPSVASPPTDAQVSGFGVSAALDLRRLTLVSDVEAPAPGAPRLLTATLDVVGNGPVFPDGTDVNLFIAFGDDALDPSDRNGSSAIRANITATAHLDLLADGTQVVRFTGVPGLAASSGVEDGRRVIFALPLVALHEAAGKKQRLAAENGDGTWTVLIWTRTHRKTETDQLPDTDDLKDPDAPGEVIRLIIPGPER